MHMKSITFSPTIMTGYRYHLPEEKTQNTVTLLYDKLLFTDKLCLTNNHKI